MAIKQPKIREDVVKSVSMDLLEYLSDQLDEDLEPSELLSVAFTVAMNISITVLEHSTPENVDFNRQEILNAIGVVYSAIKPETMH